FRQRILDQPRADPGILFNRNGDLNWIAALLLDVEQWKLRFVFRAGLSGSWSHGRSADRECDTTFLRILEQLLKLLFASELTVFDGACIRSPYKILKQRREFQFAEQRAASFVVRLLCAHGFEIQMYGHIGINRNQLFAAQDDIAIVKQRFAIGLALNFIGVIERVLD